jgi:asparagine synthase (glutamine-hydrolysing)
VCGIAGLWRRDGAPIDHAALERIGAAVAHRGPDAFSLWSEPGIGLLSRRFSLEDIDGGSQPARYSGVTVVWNGEIFNWRELAIQYGLDGVTGDTALLPRLISRGGPEALSQINGQFAIAAWDGRERRLILARDAAGILPLVYSDTGGAVRFASELAGLLADPEIPRDLDEEAVAYFARMGFFAAPTTPLAAVRQLEPGTVRVFQARGERQFRFGQPWLHRDYHGRPDQAAAELADRMYAAVSRRISGSSPWGLFLSGGVDSALIAACLGKSGVEAPAYTVGFSGQGETKPYHFREGFERDQEVFSEFDLAAATARALKQAAPQRVEAGAAALIGDFPEIIRRQDIPCMSISTPPLYYLTGQASQQIRVALSGGGADELFAGYAHCDPARYEGATSTVDRYLDLVQVFSPDELAEIGSPLAATSELVGEAIQLQVTWAADAPREGLAWVLAAERLGPLPQNILQKNDRIGMANPLEMRYPFLDSEVVTFAERLPLRLLTGKGGGKIVVKEAAKKLGVPHKIAYRKKIRLQAPYATYLDDPVYREYFKRLVAEPAAGAPRLYDPEKAVAYLFGPAAANVWRRPAKIMLLASWNQWLAGLC